MQSLGLDNNPTIYCDGYSKTCWLSKLGTLACWIIKNEVFGHVLSFLEYMEILENTHAQVSKLGFMSQSDACQLYPSALSMNQIKTLGSQSPFLSKIVFIY